MEVGVRGDAILVAARTAASELGHGDVNALIPLQPMEDDFALVATNLQENAFQDNARAVSIARSCCPVSA